MNAKLAGSMIIALVTTFGGRALAEPEPSAAAPPPIADSPSSGRSERWSPTSFGAPRPWTYLDDPSLPGPLHVVALVRGTYMVAESPSRPLGGSIGNPGATGEIGAELGILNWMSVAASGLLGGTSGDGGTSFGALAGLRVAPFAALLPTTSIVFSGGYVREISRDEGVWGRIAVSQDLGRVRLGGLVHAEHMVTGQRDPVDLHAMLGVHYAVMDFLRVGAEYVVQDLEALTKGKEEDDPEEDGGLRHVLGPSAQFALLREHLSITAGVGFGLSTAAPPVTGRVAVAYAY